MGSDGYAMDDGNGQIVSIHAPVWGATAHQHFADNNDGVSIHAPVWGATLAKTAFFTGTDGFNPRSRMGSDSNHVQFFYHFP